MGSMYEAGITEAIGEGFIGREQGLYLNLTANFYPRLPSFVVQSTIDGFKKYWAGEIGLDELREACYLSGMESLYLYFYSFLNAEDVEED